MFQNKHCGFSNLKKLWTFFGMNYKWLISGSYCWTFRTCYRSDISKAELSKPQSRNIHAWPGAKHEIGECIKILVVLFWTFWIIVMYLWLLLYRKKTCICETSNKYITTIRSEIIKIQYVLNSDLQLYIVGSRGASQLGGIF